MEKRSLKMEISVVSKDGERKEKSELVREEAIVIRIDGEIHKLCCIPSDLEAMISGNLRSRGILPSLARIRKIANNEFGVDLSLMTKSPRNPQRCQSERELSSREVFDLVELLNENSVLHKKTGCTHVVGIRGEQDVFVEDISRHCAIDKAIGLAPSRGIDLSNSLLVTSCRQTASTIKKAIFCQIPIVISIAAPTDLAVREADRYGITLIGFATSKRFNIYSNGWRIKI